MIRTLALDEGWTTTAQAEHETLERFSVLGLRALLACTHFLPADGELPPRVAVTAQVSDPGGDAVHAVGSLSPKRQADTRNELGRLLAAHVTGTSGRAFVFPGLDALDRVLTVGTLLSSSAVDDVVALGGAEVPHSARLDTQNHLRPEFSAGHLRLRVRPVIGGGLVPFEQPHPTPCCADHA